MKFRESKYLNESGTKIGNWYMNRIDYFQFHEYPAYKKHKFLSIVACILVYFTGLKVMETSFLTALPFFYFGYLFLLSFVLLRSKRCRYKGYFLYPTRIISFFKSIEVDVDLNDFDSIATMSKK